MLQSIEAINYKLVTIFYRLVGLFTNITRENTNPLYYRLFITLKLKKAELAQELLKVTRDAPDSGSRKSGKNQFRRKVPDFHAYK